MHLDPDAGLRRTNVRIPGDPRPDRANCRYRGRPIERDPDGAEWTAGNGPGPADRNTQYSKAPTRPTSRCPVTHPTTSSSIPN